MTREEIILSHIRRDGLGLEIGAGCAPFHPSQGSEFYIALSRAGVLPPGTRLDLLQEVLREQSVT